MNRPLAVVLLTIFVNLVGFGIIVPLLPFYAETFGASPIAVGLLFAVFSLAQLVASPVLGELSDRYGRRPVLLGSLGGTVVSFVMLALAGSLTMLFVARIIDGLSGGSIATARAYVADVTAPQDRARAYGLIGAAFGLGFILGPAASGLLAPISYTAPIWTAAAVTGVALGMAWVWLPETAPAARAPAGNQLRTLATMFRRPRLRRVLVVDFWYWFAFAVFQTTFALFVARRFGFSARQTGYFFAAFGALGVLVQVALIRPMVSRLGDKGTLRVGLVFTCAGLVGAALTESVMLFAVALVPLACGVGFGHPTMSSLVSRAAPSEEQGRIQGAAGALESLGRTIGPVWGGATLQRFGDAAPYFSAASLLLLALILTMDYRFDTADGGLDAVGKFPG